MTERTIETQPEETTGTTPAARSPLAGPASRNGSGAAPRINDFAIKIATVNGTGSASANGLLMQAIFRMGVPVSGKNVFPSNIQGLPTWYEIRVNGAGHTARTPDFDVFVAMNADTYARDVRELQPGGYLIHDSTWPMDPALARPDIHFLPIPLAALCNDAFSGARERLLMKNIGYLGALAALLDVDTGIIDELLQETYGAKQALMESNRTAVRLGYDYASEHFTCPLPLRLRRLAKPDDYILIDGNTATALGCIYAGATVCAWYPITPATAVTDAFTSFCKRFRKDPETGKNRYMIVQAEDELAAAGVVVGANWVGARAFTPTSGPGISLMSEFIGLAYYAEIPSVFIDVQRTGPSTGMPTRTQQGDIMLCAYASHGDTKHIVLFPADPRECFDFAVRAFDLAERFQTPVFLVSDLDIGMNDWMVPKLTWDDAYRPDRGKVLTAEQLEGMKTFHRYVDIDGDGIAARTLPGVHPRGAFFTRGSGHNRFGGYTEDAGEYVDVMDRIARKIANAASAVPPPAIRRSAGATLGLVSIGGCDRAILESIEILEREGLPLDYMRIRGFPFAPEVEAFLLEHAFSFVIEQNRDGQLHNLLILETAVGRDRLRSVRRYGGMPMSAAYVIDGIREIMAEESTE